MFNLTSATQPTPGQISNEEATNGEIDDPADIDKLELLLGKAARGSARKTTSTILQMLTPGTGKK